MKRLAQHGASRRCELLWRLRVLRSGIYRSEHREESGTCGLQQWSPKFSGNRRELKPHRICRIPKTSVSTMCLYLQRQPGYFEECVIGGEVCQQQKLKKPTMQAWTHFEPPVPLTKPEGWPESTDRQLALYCRTS